MTKIKGVKALGLTTALATVIALPGFAQQVVLNEDQMAALNEECRTLAQSVQARDTLPEGATEDETVRVINANEAEACVTYRTTYFAADGEGADAVATERVEISEEALIQGLARVRVPEPEVDVEVPAPNVRVMAGQPSVRIQEGQSTIEVEQAQPQISVEIPEIIVRVEIPAPRVFIRSDEPSVEVASSDPQIEVQQDEPRISVTQGEPEIAVDLDLEADGDTQTANADATTTSDGGNGATGGEVRIARAEANVVIERSDEQPQVEYAASQPEVTFTNSEPQVTVNMSQEPRVEIANVGEIDVTFETAEEREDRRQAAATGSEADAEGQDQWTVTIADLMDMQVTGADGADLGSPEAFVQKDGQLMLVLSEGGLLGLGDTEVGVPLAQVGYTEEALILQQMTQEELANAGAFSYDESMRVNDDVEIRIGGGN